MSSNYISLQGKFYLAPIVAGVAGVPRHIGNVPDFEIATDATIHHHAMVVDRRGRVQRARWWFVLGGQQRPFFLGNAVRPSVVQKRRC